MTATKTVARVFQDVAGWYICDDSANQLDTRGKRFDSKRDAIAWLRHMASNRQTEYTHYRTGTGSPVKL